MRIECRQTSYSRIFGTAMPMFSVVGVRVGNNYSVNIMYMGKHDGVYLIHGEQNN